MKKYLLILVLLILSSCNSVKDKHVADMKRYISKSSIKPIDNPALCIDQCINEKLDKIHISKTKFLGSASVSSSNGFKQDNYFITLRDYCRDMFINNCCQDMYGKHKSCQELQKDIMYKKNFIVKWDLE